MLICPGTTTTTTEAITITCSMTMRNIELLISKFEDTKGPATTIKITTTKATANATETVDWPNSNATVTH